MVHCHGTNHIRSRKVDAIGTVPDVELLTGVTSKAYNVELGGSLNFYVDVEKPSLVDCKSIGDSGNLDFLMSWDSINEYDFCVDTVPTSMITSTLGLGEGRVHARVYGCSAASNVTITCTVSEVLLTALTSGVPVGPYDVMIDRSLFFSLDVVDPSVIICETDSSNDVAYLDMHWGNNSKYGCSSGGDPYATNCVAGPDSGRVLITLSSYDSDTDVTIKCTAQKFIPTKLENAELRDGVEAGPYNLSMGETIDFFMNVSSASIIKCETKGTYGDLDLYMNWSDSSGYECVSAGGFSMEKCSLVAPHKGIAHIQTQGFSTVIGFSITCTLQEYKPSIIENAELTSGVQAGPYNILLNETFDFFLNVSSSSIVSCETFGSSSDYYESNSNLKIHMSWGNTSDGECDSEGYATAQTCSLGPNTGIARVKVQGLSTVIGFFITCTTDEFSPSVIGQAELANGVQAGPYNLLTNESFVFHMNVASLSTLSTVTCETVGSRGDLDLHMFWGDLSDGGCTSAGATATEHCVLGPSTGMAQISVYGFSTVIGFNITCTASEFSPVQLESGVTSSSYDLNAGGSVGFLLNVPDFSTLKCVLDSDGEENHEVDFELSWKDSQQNGCSIFGTPMQLECVIGAGKGTAYVVVQSYEPVSKVAITCTSTPITIVELKANMPSGPHSLLAEQYLYFTLHDVSPGSNVTCQTTADNGDLDLYMYTNDSNVYDCTSASDSSMESCSAIAHSGNVFAIAYGFLPTEKFSITCTD